MMENLYNNNFDDEDQHLLQRRGSRIVHDESNKLMVQIEEQYVHQIAQEHRRNTQNLRDEDMPEFDDDSGDEKEPDNRDTLLVGKNTDEKLFENVEEMLKLQEDGKELEFEEAKTALESILNSSQSSEAKPRMSRRQSRRPANEETTGS